MEMFSSPSLSLDGTSTFIVSDGSVIFKENSSLVTARGTALDIHGLLRLTDRVCFGVDGVAFIISGRVLLDSDSCFSLKKSTLDVSGDLKTSQNHKLTVMDSNIKISRGSVLFSGTSASSTTLLRSNLTLESGGTFTVAERTSFAISAGAVTVKAGTADRKSVV